MSTEPTKYYAMQCPHCQKRLKVSSKDLGQQRACPSCKKPITIGQPGSPPPEPSAANAPPKRSAASEEFSVDCAVCGTLFYATLSDVGKTIDCPDCLSEHLVKAPAKQKVVKSKPVDDGDEYQLAPSDEPVRTKAPSPQGFRVHCPVCKSSLAALPNQIGSHLECPDCGTNVAVVKPKERKKRKIELSKEKIGVENAADLSVQRAEAQRKVNSAVEAEVEKIRQRPDPPKQPFIEGVYSYPFHQRVPRVWALLTPLGSVVAILAIAGLNAEGGAQFFAILMMMVAAVMGLVFLTCVGFTMVTLLNSTAMGYPHPEEWPRIDWGEWFGATLYLVSAGCISMLPIMLFGGSLGPIGRTIGSLGLLFVFFPFLLLSMMDADSPAVPFSPYVWQTLVKRSGQWIKFYMSAGLLAAVLAGVFAATTFLGMPGVPILVLAIMFTMTIYFRLLGRLAWVLDQEPIVLPGKEEETEDEAELAEV